MDRASSAELSILQSATLCIIIRKNRSKRFHFLMAGEIPFPLAKDIKIRLRLVLVSVDSYAALFTQHPPKHPTCNTIYTTYIYQVLASSCRFYCPYVCVFYVFVVFAFALRCLFLFSVRKLSLEGICAKLIHSAPFPSLNTP